MAKKYKKKKLWTQTEEEVLVELWGDRISELRGNRRNGHIYSEMAQNLEVMNIIFTPEEVKMKIHNLTNRYRSEKKIVRPSGGSPSKWHLYDKVHQLLGGMKLFNLELLVEDSIVTGDEGMNSETGITESDDSMTPGTSSSTNRASPRAAKKRKGSESDLDEEIKKTLKIIQQTSEQFIEIEKERNEHLKSLINILKN